MAFICLYDGSLHLRPSLQRAECPPRYFDPTPEFGFLFQISPTRAACEAKAPIQNVDIPDGCAEKLNFLAQSDGIVMPDHNLTTVQNPSSKRV